MQFYGKCHKIRFVALEKKLSFDTKVKAVSYIRILGCVDEAIKSSLFVHNGGRLACFVTV